MMNQFGGFKTDFLVKLVLIFFISLLSFSVGTFVGKKFSDNQYRQASLEREYGPRETASVAPDVLDTKPDSALTDEDIARLQEEFTNEGSLVPAGNSEPTNKDVHRNKASVDTIPSAKKETTDHGPKKTETSIAKATTNTAPPTTKQVAESKSKIETSLAKASQLVKSIIQNKEPAPSQAATQVVADKAPVPPNTKEIRLPSSLPAAVANNV
jgi:hypothetical protein